MKVTIMAAPRVPLTFFGISLGMAGLAGVWLTAAHEGTAPVWVGNALAAAAAAVWVATLLLYLRYAVSTPGILRADMLDGVTSPFASVVVITPMLLAAQALVPHAPDVGRVVVNAFLIISVLMGGWYTGQWIYGPMKLEQMHPGYFLPTVGGGLVAAFASAQVGQARLAEIMFGFGIISWLVMGSMILARLFFLPPLPAPLLPTLAIEVVPASMASVACFALNGGRNDLLAAVLAGYCVLMIIAQVRLLPVYFRLKFAPSFWSFTFPAATAATTALHWIGGGQSAGELLLTYLVLGAVTVLVCVIGARTLVSLRRRQFFPVAASASQSASDQPTSAPTD
ncbi:SLAC1 family transporter [Streptomyces sp. 900116325]